MTAAEYIVLFVLVAAMGSWAQSSRSGSGMPGPGCFSACS
jgi:hypothetical protein